MSNSLLCRSTVRRFLLEYAGRTRHHKFTRVSGEAFDTLESRTRDNCRKLVDSQASKGATIK